MFVEASSRSGSRTARILAATLAIGTSLLATSTATAQDAAQALTPEAAARAFARANAADSASAGANSPTSEEALSERIPGLVRAALATPKQEAERLAEEAIWRTLRPWQRVRRMRDARYWYIGGSFDALIFDDGQVELRDKAGPTLAMGTVMAPSKSAGAGPLPNARDATAEEGGRRSLGNPKFGGSKPGEGAAGSLGVSIPYAGRTTEQLATGKRPADAEVRAFLERTSALREFLAIQELERHRAQERRRLDIKLYQLWNAAGPLSPKQDATFATWDEAADDEVGAIAREQIETFIRELERERGECPFTRKKLNSLNARRKSGRSFTPCLTPAP